MNTPALEVRDPWIEQALKNCELLAGVAEADLRALVGNAPVVSFAAGETLLHPGQLNLHVYIVLDGVVESLRSTGPGTSEVVARQGVGSVQGDMSALSGRPVNLQVRALVPVRVLVLDKEVALTALEGVPRLGANLATMMMDRMHGLLGKGAAHVVLLAVDAASENDLQLARQLLACVGRYAPRVVVADLTDRLMMSRARGLPSLSDLLATPARSGDILRDMASGHGFLWTVRPGANPPVPRQLAGLLGFFDPYCDVLVVAADPYLAAQLAEALPDRFGDVVVVNASAQRQDLSSLTPALRDAGQLPRMLVTSPTTPANVGESRALDEQFGARTFTSAGTVTDPFGLDGLARAMARQRLGLALGAGAAKGFAHIGVLERLAERGVPMDVIVGCSAGAGVGSMWSIGYDAKRILDLFAQLEKHAVRWTFPSRSILSGRALATFMRRSTVGAGFDQSRQPLGIVVVDLYAARERVMSSGDMVSCVLASSAIPGVYPPIQLGEQWFVDGGVLNPVPSAFVKPMGADRVISVDLSALPEQPEVPPPGGPRLLGVLRHSANLMHARITEHSRGGANLLLRPDSGDEPVPGFRDYNKASSWYRYGRESVDRQWSTIVELLPWLERRETA